jgi:hypothetical protein
MFLKQLTPLHPKTYKSKIFFDINSTPDYIEMLILSGIGTATLPPRQQKQSNYKV